MVSKSHQLHGFPTAPIKPAIEMYMTYIDDRIVFLTILTSPIMTVLPTSVPKLRIDSKKNFLSGLPTTSAFTSAENSNPETKAPAEINMQ